MSNQLVKTDTTDSQLIKMWLFGKSEHTQRAYLADVQAFSEWFGRGLREITVADLQAYIADLSGSKAKQGRVIASIKSLLSFAVKAGYLAYNAGIMIKPIKQNNRITDRILSIDEIREIITSEPVERNRQIMTLLYVSAMRISEIVDLRESNILENPDGSTVLEIHGKGDKTRHVVISDRSLLSVIPLGISQHQVWHIVKSAGERVGIKVSPHYFRHSCATHALWNKAPVALVQQQLGHSSLVTTSKYLHVSASEGLDKFLKV